MGARLQCGAFVLHPPTDWHVADAFPDSIHRGQHHLVWLLDVDGIRVRHPAGPASAPEHFGAVPFRVKEVAANGATVVGNRVSDSRKSLNLL